MKTTKLTKKIFAAAVCAAVMLAIAATAAPASPSPQAGAEGQSQTMKLLTLKKAQLQLEKTRGDYERSLKLLEQGLTSEQEFALVKTTYQQAQVDFQQALINFMGSEARISVASAVKFQDAGG